MLVMILVEGNMEHAPNTAPNDVEHPLTAVAADFAADYIAPNAAAWER